MDLTKFLPGVVGFNAAVKSGAAVQLNPAESIVVGAGLPIWPALALRHVATALPSPEALAMEVMRGIQLALPVVRGGALALQAAGGVATALSPVAGVVGPALAPVLNAIPYAGPALGAAATAAGPIVAAGGIGASVVGAVGGATPDPAALNNLGEQIAGQLKELERNSTVDDVIIDVPQRVEV